MTPVATEAVMAIELKVRKLGNSLGAVLPREALDRLKVGEGERLFLTETPDGYRITPYDPEFEKQLDLAEEGMSAYRNTLRAPSKSWFRRMASPREPQSPDPAAPRERRPTRLPCPLITPLSWSKPGKGEVR
jgi:putative addiction module antidote